LNNILGTNKIKLNQIKYQMNNRGNCRATIDLFLDEEEERNDGGGVVNAILSFRLLLDRYHELYRLNDMIYAGLYETLYAIGAQDHGCDNGSTACLFGVVIKKLNDPELASGFFDIAASYKHVFAIYMKSRLMYEKNVDISLAIRMMRYAAQQGCGRAWAYLCRIYIECGIGYLKFHNAALCAYNGAYICGDARSRIVFEKLTEAMPIECAPMGIWAPKRAKQILVPHQIKMAIFTSLLVCKRLRIPKYPALKICEFICTNPCIRI